MASSACARLCALHAIDATEAGLQPGGRPPLDRAASAVALTSAAQATAAAVAAPLAFAVASLALAVAALHAVAARRAPHAR